jgi:hypothetical protein
MQRAASGGRLPKPEAEEPPPVCEFGDAELVFRTRTHNVLGHEQLGCEDVCFPLESARGLVDFVRATIDRLNGSFETLADPVAELVRDRETLSGQGLIGIDEDTPLRR